MLSAGLGLISTQTDFPYASYTARAFRESTLNCMGCKTVQLHHQLIAMLGSEALTGIVFTFFTVPTNAQTDHPFVVSTFSTNSLVWMLTMIIHPSFLSCEDDSMSALFSPWKDSWVDRAILT